VGIGRSGNREEWEPGAVNRYQFSQMSQKFIHGGDHMYPLPTQCPITGGPIVVTRFVCPESGLVIEGEFVVNTPFATLSPEQLQFVEAFVRNEGKLNRLEEELKLSYPTLRTRLHEVIRAMGHEPGKDEARDEGKRGTAISTPERQRVLQELSDGAIDFDTAMARLQGEN